MNWQAIAAIGAPVLTFLGIVVGLWFKSRADKADRQAAERQSDRDQDQEDLQAARNELRAIQGDLTAARAEMTRQQQDMQELWNSNAAARRELTAALDHIADVHRWDDAGRIGPMPAWRST